MRRAVGVLIAATLIAAACSSEDDPSIDASTSDDPTAVAEVAEVEEPAVELPSPTEAPTVAPVPTQAPSPTPEPAPTLTLNLPLPATSDGAMYEAWLITAERPVSVGSFDLASGPQVVLTVDPSVTGIIRVVITVETDTDPAPSATKVLAGDVVDGRAELTATHAAALGVDFTDSAGEYILATPTDGTGSPENERSGVWWTFIPRAQSIDLPALPAGWIYEGWQIIDGIPVTSGTFTTLFGEPDNSAPFSGPMPGPPFPGEDFVTNAPTGLTFPRDLRGTEVVISIEPFPDTSADPFPLIPLRGIVPADAEDHVSYPVDNVSADLLVGTATLS